MKYGQSHNSGLEIILPVTSSPERKQEWAYESREEGWNEWIRERVWAGKEVRVPEIRGWEPPGGWQFGDNQMDVLMPSQATKSLPWEMRQGWEKMRNSREPSLFLLHSPGSWTFCCSSKGIFIFTLSAPSVIFLPDSLWNLPAMLK